MFPEQEINYAMRAVFSASNTIFVRYCVLKISVFPSMNVARTGLPMLTKYLLKSHMKLAMQIHNLIFSVGNVSL